MAKNKVKDPIKYPTTSVFEYVKDGTRDKKNISAFLIEGMEERVRKLLGYASIFHEPHTLGDHKFFSRLYDATKDAEGHKISIGTFKNGEKEQISIKIDGATPPNDEIQTNLPHNAYNCDILASLISAINPRYEDFLIARDLKNRVAAAARLQTINKEPSVLDYGPNPLGNASQYGVSFEESIFSVPDFEKKPTQNRLFTSLFIDPAMLGGDKLPERDPFHYSDIRPDSPLSKYPAYVHWKWFANEHFATDTNFGKQLPDCPSLETQPIPSLKNLREVAEKLRTLVGGEDVIKYVADTNENYQYSVYIDGTGLTSDFNSIYKAVLKKLSEGVTPTGAEESIASSIAQTFCFLNTVQDIQAKLNTQLKALNITKSDLLSTYPKAEDFVRKVLLKDHVREDKDYKDLFNRFVAGVKLCRLHDTSKNKVIGIPGKKDEEVKGVYFFDLNLGDVASTIDQYLQTTTYSQLERDTIALSDKVEQCEERKTRFDYYTPDDEEIDNKPSKSKLKAKRINKGNDSAVAYHYKKHGKEIHIRPEGQNSVIRRQDDYSYPNRPGPSNVEELLRNRKKEDTSIDFQKLLNDANVSLFNGGDIDNTDIDHLMGALDTRNAREKLYRFKSMIDLFVATEYIAHNGMNGPSKIATQDDLNRFFKNSFGLENSRELGELRGRCTAMYLFISTLESHLKNPDLEERKANIEAELLEYQEHSKRRDMSRGAGAAPAAAQGGHGVVRARRGGGGVRPYVNHFGAGGGAAGFGGAEPTPAGPPAAGFGAAGFGVPAGFPAQGGGIPPRGGAAVFGGAAGLPPAPTPAPAGFPAQGGAPGMHDHHAAELAALEAAQAAQRNELLAQQADAVAAADQARRTLAERLRVGNVARAAGGERIPSRRNADGGAAGARIHPRGNAGGAAAGLPDGGGAAGLPAHGGRGIPPRRDGGGGAAGLPDGGGAAAPAPGGSPSPIDGSRPGTPARPGIPAGAVFGL